jgi:membrane protein
MARIKKFIKQILNITKKREMRILPGQLAFFLVLSLVPMLTLMVFLFTRFSLSLDTIIEFVVESFPKEVSDMIIPSINNTGSSFNVLIFMLTGFFIASNGPHSIIITSNLLYDIEGGNFVKRRTKALFMTFVLVSLFMFTVVVLGFGSTILKLVLDFNIVKNFTNELFQIIELTKWPLSMLFMFISIKLLYTIAPDSPIPSKYMNKGSLFTTFGWAFITSIYSYYVSNIVDYGIFYGGLANLVILMIWIYILAYIFVLGIAINTNHYKESLKQG